MWGAVCEQAWLDGALQRLLQRHNRSVAGHYVHFVLPAGLLSTPRGADGQAAGRVVVGQYRHTWMWAAAAGAGSGGAAGSPAPGRCPSHEACFAALVAPLLAHMISPLPGVRWVLAGTAV